MKLLITGHKGFIGSNALKHFQKQNEVDCYEWSTEFPDLSKGYDWVLHFGAISSTTERDVEKIMLQNYDFSRKLITQCNDLGINLQYSSSASIYGLNKEFKEDSPVDPRTPYSWSKYMFERFVQDRHWNITVQGFRYFNVFGPGEDHKGTQASPYHQFTKQAKTLGSISLFSNSENYLRDFVPVERVIEIHDRFLNITQSGIWNVGTGRATSFESVARMISDNYPAQVSYVPMPEQLKASYQEYTCADLTKLTNTLNEESNS